MKSHTEKRYTRSQVIIMMAITFSLVAVVSYAWNLSAPYTFSANTTISSSAMNSNFDFVESRLGAVNVIAGGSGSVTSTSYSAPQNFLTWTFTAPQNGYVLLTGSANSVQEYRGDTTCSYQSMYLGVSTSSTSVGTAGFWYTSRPSLGWELTPFNAQTMIYVYAGSSYTVYINAYRDSTGCASNYYYISGSRLTAQFFPTYL